MDALFDTDPARIDTSLESRSISFENPTGERGAGGRAHGGRKGAPSDVVAVGERRVLADITGPGRIRHIWMTVPPMPPERLRAITIEVFYDGASEPSVSVPLCDYFGLPHGRPVHYASALCAVQEGRGFNSYVPVPFPGSVRVELVNGTDRPLRLYYQIDYTLERELGGDVGWLHAAFRRENPTVPMRDFTIWEGLEGAGRFLGCSLGIRVLPSPMMWYGEGEVKFYLDGDEDLPTICGTGLEDYVGSAWGMDRHLAPDQGVPLVVRDPKSRNPNPQFVGFYRWHLRDPIVFRESLRVTIQQIGACLVSEKNAERFDEIRRNHPAAGEGWQMQPGPGVHAFAIAERSDDYCATAFVYTSRPQPVPRVDVAQACADLERRPYEQPDPLEEQLPGA